MKLECPILDYSCPYCVGGNCCLEEMEGADPQECDAFFGLENMNEDVVVVHGYPLTVFHSRNGKRLGGAVFTQFVAHRFGYGGGLIG